MTQFILILEDGSLYKNVFIKIGRFFAKNNSEIYWDLKENDYIEIFRIDGNKSLSAVELSNITEEQIIETLQSTKIYKNEIYYFTISKKYQHS